MNIAKVIMIFGLFSTMKTTIGQEIYGCHCYTATRGSRVPCDTPGCSLGTNPYCNDGTFDQVDNLGPYNGVLQSFDVYPFILGPYFGCNCPNTPSNSTHNGYYGDVPGPFVDVPGAYHDYDTCTGYGGNAHSANGTVAPYGNIATVCCNFCCNRTDPIPTTTTITTDTTTTTDLPLECYHPDGSSCDWYRNCLEKKHPCQGDPDDYAIKYATKYCNLYTENYNKFSATGQKWVDAVRKCLQIKLVPLLSELSSSVTCKQIKEDAFASHTSCYTEPYPDAPSISFCYLNGQDILMVFDTIKSAFFDELIASIEGFFSTVSYCHRQIVADMYRLLKMFISVGNNTLVNRTPEPFGEGDDIAKLIADGIAQIESWDPKRISYFPYSTDTSEMQTKTQEQQTTIEILLLDKFVWDNKDNTSIANVTQMYLNTTINHLAQSVQQGKLELNTTNGTFHVKQMHKCLNVTCNGTDGYPAIISLENFAIGSVSSNIFLMIVLVCVLLLAK